MFLFNTLEMLAKRTKTGLKVSQTMEPSKNYHWWNEISNSQALKREAFFGSRSQRLLFQALCKCGSVSKHMIWFTGASTPWQYLPINPDWFDIKTFVLVSAEGWGSGETGFGSRVSYIWLKLYILVQKCAVLSFSKIKDVEEVRGKKVYRMVQQHSDH